MLLNISLWHSHSPLDQTLLPKFVQVKPRSLSHGNPFPTSTFSFLTFLDSIFSSAMRCNLNFAVHGKRGLIILEGSPVPYPYSVKFPTVFLNIHLTSWCEVFSNVSPRSILKMWKTVTLKYKEAKIKTNITHITVSK